MTDKIEVNYKTMFTNYPDVINVKQMQEMLGGISSKLAYRLLNNGIIKSVKIGREFKISKTDIIAYITQSN